MGKDSFKTMVRGAMLLAVALVAQELRLILPLPPIISIFVIGTMLNAVMVIAVRFAGLKAGLIIATALPIVAYLQGHLLLPIMIPVVVFGNLVLVTICGKWWGKGVIFFGPVLKTLALYSGSLFVLRIFGIQQRVAEVILISMGWPQLITAIIGTILAAQIEKRLFLVKK
ncbi:MAG: hypothetical protein EOL98_01545 [Negativicutes bacterium]|nr:hypothetical protein [Negativicutes bacterium]